MSGTSSRRAGRATGIRVLLAIGALLATLAVARAWIESRRTSELQHWAAGHGYRFDHHPADPLPGEVADLGVLHMGRSPRYDNLVTGTVAGMSFEAFDYAFYFRRGRGGRVQTAVLFHDPVRVWPAFVVFPRNVAAGDLAVPPAGGGRFIGDVESNPLFTNRYLLRDHDDPTLARTLRAFLLGAGRNWGWRIEGRGHWLVVCLNGSRVPTGRMEEFLRRTAALADSLAGPGADPDPARSGSPNRLNLGAPAP
jgi:hypothetical protein